MTFQITPLDNGLRVASESLPGVETVGVTLSVGVGARYESDEENGVSHLLEHMAFKGTKTRSARDIAELFDSIGGQFNAYTSMEHTVYYTKVLKENLALAVDILADIMQHSVFDNAELAREQEVIVQEIAMHHDSPEDLVVDLFDERAFEGQALGRSILSTPERIRAATREGLIAYMQKHYRPTRMVLSAAGHVAHEEFVSMAQRSFRQPALPPGPECERARYVGGDHRKTGDFEQLHLLLGLPGLPYGDPDYYALQLYVSILGGGMSSRLFQEVRENRGLAYSVYAGSSSYHDVGVMSISAATAPEKAQELAVVLCEQIRAMAHNITETEITRAKNQHRAELLMTRENPQAVAGWIGRHLLIHGEYRPASVITQRVQALTRHDLLRVAQRVASGTLTVAALGDVSRLPEHAALQAALA